MIVRFLLLLGCASLALSCGAAPGGSGRLSPPSACLTQSGTLPDSLIHLTFLATNDLHGALEGRVHPWSDGREVGGAAVLAGFIARARSGNPRGTVLLDGGDIMQGTAISNLVQGESTIAFLNAAGYDAAAIGNHEFDWGVPVLEERIAQARFPLLSANIFRAGQGDRPAWSVPTALLERKGLKIGLIGLTTRTTPTATLPANVEGLEFTDLAAAVNDAAPELKKAGADLIVVIAHAGGYFSAGSNSFHGEIVEAMRSMSPEVDLVVSGHTHTLLNGEVNGIPLVQARSAGTALATVEVWVDGLTRAVACSEAEVETTFADRVAPVPEVAALVARYRERMGTAADRVVAEAAHRLTRDRRRESVLGDLIADSQRAATGARIALMNSGGIRAEIAPGPITWREAFEVQPFENDLYRLELDGRTLKEALENGVAGDHGLVQVSGVRFEVDPAAPRGSRVRRLALEDGSPVHPDSVYSVAVNNFMAQGGDHYTMLRDTDGVTNTGVIDLDAFVEHLEGLPQPVRYDLKGRIRFVEEPRVETRADTSDRAGRRP